MLDFLKRKETKKDYELKAAADGQVVPMTEASDSVFSGQMLGSGIVIRPTGDVVVAPGDGTISTTTPGGNHAVGLKLEGGVEVLIHIGVDTVKQKGEGFTCLVKSGDRVKTGDELVRFDRGMLEAKGYCMEIMEIVTGGENSSWVKYSTGMEAKAGETTVGSWQA